MHIHRTCKASCAAFLSPPSSHGGRAMTSWRGVEPPHPETRMTTHPRGRPNRSAFAALAGLAAVAAIIGSPSPAAAQEVKLRAVRIAAADPAKLAEFYTAAFGFREIRRIAGDGFLEVIMKTGSDSVAAAANPDASLVIITRPPDLQMGGLGHVILGVADVSDSLDHAVEKGASRFRDPKPAGGGAAYAFLKDPEGNQVELLGPD
ncbi:hypothetical protein GC169_10045 [bacterium]|nr:hypothetical protein [bacterium]